MKAFIQHESRGRLRVRMHQYRMSLELEHMERIAQLFEVPVESLLDDYNLFL